MPDPLTPEADDEEPERYEPPDGDCLICGGEGYVSGDELGDPSGTTQTRPTVARRASAQDCERT